MARLGVFCIFCNAILFLTLHFVGHNRIIPGQEAQSISDAMGFFLIFSLGGRFYSVKTKRPVQTILTLWKSSVKKSGCTDRMNQPRTEKSGSKYSIVN
jgi:hypothetical protein